MKVFISWSGSLSRELAGALRDWLPSAFQAVRPYFTPSDIEKGTRWANEIAQQLADSDVGIFCLTADNLASPWMLFEAGAISKTIQESRVCPILFGIEPTDVAGPLSQFQATPFCKEDMRKLVEVINDACGEQALDQQTVERVFEKWWPDLERSVEGALRKHQEGSNASIRTDRDLMEEILTLTRMIARDQHTIPLMGADKDGRAIKIADVRSGEGLLGHLLAEAPSYPSLATGLFANRDHEKFSRFFRDVEAAETTLSEGIAKLREHGRGKPDPSAED